MATEVERLAVVVEANTRQFNTAMKRMERNLAGNMQRSGQHVRTLDSRMSKLGLTASSIGKTFTRGLLAGGAVVLFQRLGSTIGDVSDEMSKLVDVADKVGLTTDQLQELRFAAEQSGVATNTLDMAMQRFSRRVGEAVNGTGELKDTLKRLGIEVRNTDGSVRSQVDILGDLANAIQATRSEQGRLSIAFKAFDSEGAALVNMLANGERGLNDFLQAARDAGVVLDEELLRSMKDVDDRMAALAATIGTKLKGALASAVLTTANLVEEFKRLGTVAADFLGSKNAIAQARGGSQSVSDVFSSIPRESQPVSELVEPPSQDAVNRANKTKEVIEQLQFEYVQLARNSEQRAVYNQLRAAGVDITSKEGIQIATLVEQIERETAAQEARTEAIEDSKAASMEMQETLADSFEDLILRGDKFSDVIKGLANQIASMALKATLLGKGPLAGLFDTKGGGGLLGALFSGFKFASGGNPPVNQPYLVGENGPEIRFDRSQGTVVSNKAISSVGQSNSIQIVSRFDADGGFHSAVERTSRPIAQQESATASAQVMRAVPGMVDTRNDELKTRRIRPRAGAF